MRKWRFLAVILAVMVFSLDQLSKYWLRTAMVPAPESLIIVTPFFNLNHAWNYGTAFSLFWSTAEAQKWWLVSGTGAMSLGLLIWLLKATQKITIFAIGLILGGAIGNIYDRVNHGAVFDFLQFHLADYYWPSFNLADSAIVCGVALLLWESWQHDAKQRKQNAGA